MGYESRAYLVALHRYGKKVIWAEDVAKIDLSKMGYGNGWRELFKRDIDYKLYADDRNTQFDTDCYGEHMKAASVDDVIKWLEKEMSKDDCWWRVKLLHGLLSSLPPEDRTAFEVVHFGY